ncbi:MAG: hypothetical protein AMXMBFR84_04460 [Candidatus Hydrogenedentota bacterium]
MRISRRTFLRGSLAGLPALTVCYAWAVEPAWLRVRIVRISESPSHRLVHFTDLHHKGNRRRLRQVVECINGLSPDFVCFTGDIVEDKRFVNEALDEMVRIAVPMYGCPGNHDHWSGSDFAVIAQAFEATGGRWLVNQTAEAAHGAVGLVGVDDIQPPKFLRSELPKRILLGHYPETADHVEHAYTLLLAGHSHGGQIRLPFAGALILPGGCANYDRALFKTPAGPLYVNPGIGMWMIPVRFLCRPEVTVFEV